MRVCVGTYERVVLGLEKALSGDKLVPFFAAEDHSARPTAIAANCSGKLLVAGFADDLLRVYSLDALKEIGLLDKHSGTPTEIKFVHGDNLMLCVAEDGALSVWRVADWECLAICTSSNKKKRQKRNIKQNNKEFEVEGEEEEEEESNDDVPEEKGKQEIVEKGDPLLSLAVHFSEKLALSINKKGFLVVWDLVNYSCVKSVKLEFPTNNGIIAWTNSSDHYVIPSGESLKVYDINSKLVSTIDNQSKVLCITNTRYLGNDIDQLNDCIFTGAEDGVLRIWNVRSSELLFQSEPSKSRIRGLDSNYDGENVHIATGSSNGEIKVYKISTSPQFLVELITNHTSSGLRVTCMSLILKGLKKKNKKKNKRALGSV